MNNTMSNRVLETKLITGFSIQELDEVKHTLLASLFNVTNRMYFLDSKYSNIKTVRELKTYLEEPHELNTVSNKLFAVIVAVASLEEEITIEQFLKNFLKYPKVGLVTKDELIKLLIHLKKIDRYDDVAE